MYPMAYEKKKSRGEQFRYYQMQVRTMIKGLELGFVCVSLKLLQMVLLRKFEF